MSRFLCALLLAAAPALAAQPAHSEQANIDALIAAVESSGCRMERNGAEHDARAAAEHLRMKLERAGARVRTAAQFIEHVAAASSVSGRPYRVLCPGQPPQLARDWMQARLPAAGASAAR